MLIQKKYLSFHPRFYCRVIVLRTGFWSRVTVFLGTLDPIVGIPGFES